MNNAFLFIHSTNYSFKENSHSFENQIIIVGYPAQGCMHNLQCVQLHHMKQKDHPALKCNTQQECVPHRVNSPHMNSKKYVFWTDPFTSSIQYVIIEFHFYTSVVVISFQIVKNIYFFLVQKKYSAMASISLAMTVNSNTPPQLHLSKDRTLMGPFFVSTTREDL